MTDAEKLAYKRNGGAPGVALKKRIENGRLTAEDEALIARAKVIRERRRQGKSYRAIANELGLNVKVVNEFATRGRYRVCCDYLEAIEAGDRPVEAASAKTEHRGFLQRLVPKALRRLEAALDAGMDIDDRGKATLKESKAADHAMDTVLEATGLLEPEGAGRPSIVIETLVINGLAASIRTDDARTARDITPPSLPALAEAAP